MKSIYSLIACLILTCYSLYSQVNSELRDRQQRVNVKDWGQSSMTFAEGWWDNKKDEIVKQIGEEEFAKVIQNSGWQNIPEQMSLYNGRDKKSAEQLYQKMAQLKAYKIASFKNIFQNKYWGDFDIIRVPYSENTTWDPSAKWDTVYFIVKKEAVEVVLN